MSDTRQFLIVTLDVSIRRHRFWRRLHFPFMAAGMLALLGLGSVES